MRASLIRIRAHYFRYGSQTILTGLIQECFQIKHYLYKCFFPHYIRPCRSIYMKHMNVRKLNAQVHLVRLLGSCKY